MESIAYNDYKQRWHQPGSAFYYAILHLPETRKHDLICLQVFFNELLHVVTDYREITVAMNRLQWWQEEIQRIGEHQARHPISKELLPIIKQHDLPLDLFTEIGNSITILFHQQPVASWGDFNLLACKLFGNLQRLQLQCCGNTTAQSQAYCNHAAPGLLAGYLLERFGLDLQRGFYYFPHNLLARVSLTKTATSELPNQDQIRTLLTDKQHLQAFCKLIKQHAHQHFQQAFIIKHTTNVPKPLSTQITIMQTIALLTELVNNYNTLLTHRITLTPMRYLWISLKARARLRFFFKPIPRQPSN